MSQVSESKTLKERWPCKGNGGSGPVWARLMRWLRLYTASMAQLGDGRRFRESREDEGEDRVTTMKKGRKEPKRHDLDEKESEYAVDYTSGESAMRC